MKFDFDKIKNIAKDVSKEVVNVVGDKYLEIKANANFDDGKYDEICLHKILLILQYAE